MKFIIETEDEIEANRLMKSMDMACVLFEIASNLKKNCRRELESRTEVGTSWDGMDLVFEKIYELLDEHNINVEEIIL